VEAHPEDAKWLAEGGNRTYVDHTDASVVVIIKLPDSVTGETIVTTVMNYDVYKRTEDVELSYQANGAFFTGTRVMSFFSPTVTKNKVRQALPHTPVCSFDSCFVDRLCRGFFFGSLRLGLDSSNPRPTRPRTNEKPRHLRPAVAQ
jgi:hypothetical protein